mmetsp:Transcript_3971/g.11297  ORF Transcript_3971/g.11297 Transcript_3971/m.11297 type:complete len:289 (+) Transcript_3971:936-1802(+)
MKLPASDLCGPAKAPGRRSCRRRWTRSSRWAVSVLARARRRCRWSRPVPYTHCQTPPRVARQPPRHFRRHRRCRHDRCRRHRCLPCRRCLCHGRRGCCRRRRRCRQRFRPSCSLCPCRPQAPPQPTPAAASSLFRPPYGHGAAHPTTAAPAMPPRPRRCRRPCLQRCHRSRCLQRRRRRHCLQPRCRRRRHHWRGLPAAAAGPPWRRRRHASHALGPAIGLASTEPPTRLAKAASAPVLRLRRRERRRRVSCPQTVRAELRRLQCQPAASAPRRSRGSRVPPAAARGF